MYKLELVNNCGSFRKLKKLHAKNSYFQAFDLWFQQKIILKLAFFINYQLRIDYKF